MKKIKNNQIVFFYGGNDIVKSKWGFTIQSIQSGLTAMARAVPSQTVEKNTTKILGQDATVLDTKKDNLYTKTVFFVKGETFVMIDIISDNEKDLNSMFTDLVKTLK